MDDLSAARREVEEVKQQSNDKLTKLEVPFLC